jgi:hypothetical protein
VLVTFEAKIDKAAWDEQIRKHDLESDYFELLVNFLSIKARYTLTNDLSFEPFKKQIVTYSNGDLICNYKMTGRNGFGNMVETSVLVKYNPDKPSFE